MSNFKRSNSNNINDLAPAEFWLNVGIEVDGRTITLPVGIPIGSDTKGRGAEQQALLAAVIGMAQQVPSGQQQQLDGLKLYVRHVSTEAPASVDLGLKLKLK